MNPGTGVRVHNHEQQVRRQSMWIISRSPKPVLPVNHALLLFHFMNAWSGFQITALWWVLICLGCSPLSPRSNFTAASGPIKHWKKHRWMTFDRRTEG